MVEMLNLKKSASGNGVHTSIYIYADIILILHINNCKYTEAYTSLYVYMFIYFCYVC